MADDRPKSILGGAGSRPQQGVSMIVGGQVVEPSHEAPLRAISPAPPPPPPNRQGVYMDEVQLLHTGVLDESGQRTEHEQPPPPPPPRPQPAPKKQSKPKRK